jgi:hypothetical protein
MAQLGQMYDMTYNPANFGQQTLPRNQQHKHHTDITI